MTKERTEAHYKCRRCIHLMTVDPLTGSFLCLELSKDVTKTQATTPCCSENYVQLRPVYCVECKNYAGNEACNTRLGLVLKNPKSCDVLRKDKFDCGPHGRYFKEKENQDLLKPPLNCTDSLA